MFVIYLFKHMFPVSGPKPIARTFIRFVVTGKTAPEPVQNFNPCKGVCLPLLIYKLYPCTGPPGPPTCTRFTRWVQPARTDGTWLNLGGYKHRQPFIRPESTFGPSQRLRGQGSDHPGGCTIPCPDNTALQCCHQCYIYISLPRRIQADGLDPHEGRGNPPASVSRTQIPGRNTPDLTITC